MFRHCYTRAPDSMNVAVAGGRMPRMRATNNVSASRPKKRSTFFQVCRRAAILAVLAVASTGTAAVSPAGAVPKTTPGPRQAAPPNLVLITMDTTRADHLGAWGYPYAHTP